MSDVKVAIIDHGFSNSKSVQNMLSWIGIQSQITYDPVEIDNASHLILPGVGSFDAAMKSMFERGLVEILNTQV